MIERSTLSLSPLSSNGDLLPLKTPINTNGCRYFIFHIRFEPIPEKKYFEYYDKVVVKSSFEAAMITDPISIFS